MYHHSPQTFLSLTGQRARHSSTKQALYDDVPEAGTSAASVDGSGAPGGDHFIQFTELEDTAVQRLWADLRRSLGER